MTREEAITNLNMISVAFVEPITKEQRKLIDDTFEMAISALEQQPCEDAVSRDAVLMIASSPTLSINETVAMIKRLPSVTRQTGEWINNKDDLPICNKCGYIPPFDRAIDDFEYSNFCPNCGADMRGAE